MAVQVVKNAQGRVGYKVMAGGGMGRTPYIAHVMSEFVEREDILAYLEAVLRVYNQDSRRDNIHKQRIKILINTIGPEEMRRRVQREFEELKRMGTLQLPQDELDRMIRKTEQDKAQMRLELTNKVQDERRRRKQLEVQIRNLEEKASHVSTKTGPET